MAELTLKEDNNQVGYVDYTLENNIIYINKVFVSPYYRGQGKAKILMEKIIAFANNNDYTIKPLCSYARKYFEDNNL